MERRRNMMRRDIAALASLSSLLRMHYAPMPNTERISMPKPYDKPAAVKPDTTISTIFFLIVMPDNMATIVATTAKLRPASTIANGSATKDEEAKKYGITGKITPNR